jgi:hypothetical protein
VGASFRSGRGSPRGDRFAAPDDLLEPTDDVDDQFNQFGCFGDRTSSGNAARKNLLDVTTEETVIGSLGERDRFGGESASSAELDEANSLSVFPR